jgi:ATP-dependent DNA helicase RecQ
MTFPGIPREKTAQLLHQMIEEETVRIQNGVLFLPHP